MTKHDYYQSFIYRIEKKLTVEDHAILKDYAQDGLYLYIIHEPYDNNRFLYLSSKHYEKETKINANSFKLECISGTQESIQLNKKLSAFKVPYFELVQEKGSLNIIFDKIIQKKTKDGSFFKQYKIHTKKIALDFPDWYIEFIKDTQTINHKKKTEKILYCENDYSDEIKKHTISTLFILNKPELQRYNDHFIIMDEGRTGKTSMISYNSEKLDNISVAGLYGSSDSKHGVFKGGIVTTTKKAILIDETNELVENSKYDKILAVLNSMLENGQYNYQKQYGQKIKASNQFGFMGNISETFNLPILLNGVFGNTETLGRRIGIITYNTDLKGFKAGKTRDLSIDAYIEAISLFLSNTLNSLLNSKKFILKLNSNKLYQAHSVEYKVKIIKSLRDIEDPTTIKFFKSHSDATQRIFTRALKLYLYNNLNELIEDKDALIKNTGFLHEVLSKNFKEELNLNLNNLDNIVKHLQLQPLTDRTAEMKLQKFENLAKSHQNLLNFVWNNKDKINAKGINYKDLDFKEDIRFYISDLKRRNISQKIKELMNVYKFHIGLTTSNEVIFRIINIKAFEGAVRGIFTPKQPNTQELENEPQIKPDKKKKEPQIINDIEVIDIGEDLF